MERPYADPGSRWAVPRAFTHPGFWAALALLVLNDHLWKGAGILPSAITGKLSDFAGMVVAPPLVALLLGAQRVRARLCAAALVGLCFAAIKLAPDAARALERALGLFGVPSRIWVDPTDLWALLALPFGYALAAPRTPGRPEQRAPVARFWLERAGIALAAFACIATTGKDEKSGGRTGSGPQLRNDTDDPLAVVIASTEGAGGCSLYRDDRIALLTANAFGSAREIVLDPDETVDLSTTKDGERCGAAAIRLADGAELTVFWRDLAALESFAPADDARRAARRVVISGRAGARALEAGDDLTEFDLGADEPPSPTCPDPEVDHSLEWSALAAVQGFFEVGEVREADDGCLEVDWFALEGDTSPDTQRLCIPAWAFPFEPGDALAVVQEFEPGGARVLRVTRHAEGGDIEKQLVVWNDASEFAGARARALRTVDCVGAIAECGAYVRAVELEVRGADERLEPGQDVRVEGGAAEETRVLLGAARDVAWSAPSCTAAEAILGPTANVLELRSF